VSRAIEAVIFDWGGTLTPWHTIDLREQWAAYTRVYDPSRADLLHSVGVDPVGDRHESALRAYHDFWAPHTLIDPDAPGLLRGLRERGIRVGVLSNTLWTRAYHEEVFRRDGVLDLIDAAVYSSEIAYTKPHPEAFRAAMAAVGCGEPARAVFVGDRPYDDVHGARAVGMRAVLVPHSDIPADQRGHVEGDPHAVVQRLGDLLTVIDGWNGSERKGGA
jgi:putative hydrolase of the HAD superfamily